MTTPVATFAFIGELPSLAVLLVVVVVLLVIALRQRRRLRDLRSQLRLAAQRRKVVLDFLHDLGEAFATGINTGHLLQQIAQFSVNTTQAGAGAVFLLDPDGKNLHAEIVVGPFPPPVRPENFVEAKFVGKPDQLERLTRQQVIPVGEGLIGEVAQTGKPILIRYFAQDARLPRYNDESLRIRSAMFVPMKFRERVLGVMVVVNKQSDSGAKLFTAGDLFLLDSVATHGAISLNNIEIYKRQEEQKLVEADMRVASEIQRMLLPDEAPDVANFDLHALNHAAQHVSGDYYDFIKLDDSRIGIVIADVSGKAVSGALVMATCRALLRTQCVSTNSPASTLTQVQRRLIADLPEDMFITMTYGILDGDARTFKFARAGHDPALWYQASEKNVLTLAPKGIAVGLIRTQQFETSLQEREITLLPGDVLVLYTDGITEALDAQENEFGRERLTETIRTFAHESTAEISGRVIDRLRVFTGDGPPHDDRTLIVIKSL